MNEFIFEKCKNMIAVVVVTWQMGIVLCVTLGFANGNRMRKWQECPIQKWSIALFWLYYFLHRLQEINPQVA